MLKTMITLLLLGLITSASVDVDNAKSIHGKKVTTKELKGKVILLEYWGIF